MSMVETARPLVHRLTAGAKGQSVVNLGLHLFAAGMGFVASVLMARLLGDSGMGVYAFCFAVANVLGVVGRLGLESLVVREVAQARERQEWGLIHGLVNWSQIVTLMTSIAVTGALASFGWYWWSTMDRHTSLGLLATVVLVAGITAASLRAAALRGLHHVIAGQIPSLAVRPVLFVAILVWLLALDFAAPWAVVLAHGIAHLGAWGVAMLLWLRHRPVVRPAVVRSHEWLTSGLPLMLVGGLNLITMQADTLMLKTLAGNAATGVYAVATQLAHATAMALMVVGSVMAPRFAALYTRGDTQELQRVVTRSAQATTFATLPLTVSLILLGPLLLRIWGSEFVAGHAALSVLLLGQAINAFCGNVGQLMIMSGNERELGLVSTFTALLNITLNALLIPTLGMLGAAIATTTSLATWNLVLAMRVRALLGLHSTLLGSVLSSGRSTR